MYSKKQPHFSVEIKNNFPERENSKISRIQIQKFIPDEAGG
jgi:hypothetical protein